MSKKEKTNKQSASTNHVVVTENKNIFSWLWASVIITFIAFFPALNNDFVVWDDPEYVLNNPYIKGFDLKKIFSDFYMGNYHPLTMLWYSVQYHFFEFNPFYYHLNNLLFHLANTALIFLVIYHLLNKKNIITATFTAILFGIHPMHVESVAWISELKDVLYTFFFFSSLLAYVFYINKNYQKKYLAISLLLFLLSNFAKAQAVTLSMVLILIDYYKDRKLISKDVILEKIPFFIGSIIFGLIAIKAQKAESAINANYEGLDTIFYGSYGILTYLYKLILPIGLSGAHPYPSNPVFEPLPGYFKILPFFVIFIIALFFYFGKKNKDWWFGGLFFLFTIGIVLKFVPVGDTIIAERYTYIPYIGLFFIAGQYVEKMYQHEKWKKLSYILMAVVMITLSYLTWNRTKVWENTFTFWSDVSATYPNYWRSYNCVGQEYLAMANTSKSEGNQEQANTYYQKAIEQFTLSTEKDKWAPPVPYMIRGAVFTDYIVDYEKAANDFLKVISFPNKNDPSQLDARHNLGLVYYRMKKYNESVAILNEAIQINPNHPKAYYFRGLSLAASGKYEEAIQDYTTAVNIEPNYIDAMLNRGVVYTDKLNQHEKGLKDFQQVLSINPQHQDAYINSGICYYKMNNYTKALDIFNNVTKNNPNFARAYYLKTLVNVAQNDFASAYENGLKAKQLGMNISDQMLANWKNQIK
jgi:protein O-mannosyl-transferase